VVPNRGNRVVFNRGNSALGAIRDAGIKHFGVRIHGAGEYPESLRDAEHPIELLYFQGAWELVNTRCVAVVGTREPSEAGKSRAARLVRQLVHDGFTIVSGLARGIDTIAHTTAIAEGGSTIAVLGAPIIESYPPVNRELQARIADEHLLSARYR
jgi:DNA processing protein